MHKKTLEEGSKKIQQICDLLKNDAIEPAKKEAEAIIANAKAKAQEIISNAEKQANKIHSDTKLAIEQERNVYQSSLVQAAKQSVESLRQQFEHKFFNEQLTQLVEKHSADPKVIARLIETIIQALEKEGVAANLSVIIPKQISPKEVNSLLAENILKQIKDHSVELGNFSGGVQVKLQDKKMTLDITNDAIVELLSTYRRGFRELVFQK